MHQELTWRSFLAATPLVGLSQSSAREGPGRAAPAASPGFPQQDQEVVREMVVAAHGNLARVKELVAARPALARAGWDWGFGDWETALDGASHVGNRPIAELLITNGARPTIYSAAMMGQLSIVRGWVDAVPGVQRNRGPHGISLLSHAKAGGAPAAEVVRFLESLGDADPRYENLPLTDEERRSIVGDYAYGRSESERLRVAVNTRGNLTVQRPGATERPLFHQGGLVFNPSGAETVRLRFEVAAGRARRLSIEDGPVAVEATFAG
jgi:hypothetical protein